MSGNRAQRRAAARKDDAADIQMSQPDRSGPKGKTLMELAEERRELLSKGQPFSKQNSTTNTSQNAGKPEDDSVFFFNSDPLGAVGEAILYSVTLCMLHFTLDVLVYNQYRQDIVWSEIVSRLGRMAPALFAIIYLLHTRTAMQFGVVRQLFFLAAGVAAGCHIVYAGNHFSYFAVMKRAPPIGTLWVWSVVEMQLPYAVLSLLAVAGYMWWEGLWMF